MGGKRTVRLTGYSADADSVFVRRIGANNATCTAPAIRDLAFDTKAPSVPQIQGSLAVDGKTPSVLDIVAIRAFHDVGAVDHVSTDLDSLTHEARWLSVHFARCERRMGARDH